VSSRETPAIHPLIHRVFYLIRACEWGRSIVFALPSDYTNSSDVAWELLESLGDPAASQDLIWLERAKGGPSSSDI